MKRPEPGLTPCELMSNARIVFDESLDPNRKISYRCGNVVTEIRAEAAKQITLDLIAATELVMGLRQPRSE